MTPEDSENEEFMLERAKTDYRALSKASERLRKKPDFVLNCMRAATPIEKPTTGDAASWTAGQNLAQDRQFEPPNQARSVYAFADPSVRSNFSTTLEAASIDRCALNSSLVSEQDWQQGLYCYQGGMAARHWSPKSSHAARAARGEDGPGTPAK